ncbi:MAG: MarR family transcriptional regulator [Gaiellaceae bacterium]
MATPTVSRGADLDTWVRFLRAHSAIVGQLNAELVAEHGLTINDFEVLLHLSWAPDRAMRRIDLANSVLLTPSGITRLLEGLERGGFVTRAACKTDRRVVYAKLTEVGHDKLQGARKSHLASVYILFIERFSESELATFSELLGRLPGAAADEATT